MACHFQVLGDISRHAVPETQLAVLAYGLRQRIQHLSGVRLRIRLGQVLTLDGSWEDLVLNEALLHCGEAYITPPISTCELSPSAEYSYRSVDVRHP